MTTHLEVVEKATGAVVRTIDVQGRNARAVELVLRGLLRNMGDGYWVREVTR